MEMYRILLAITAAFLSIIHELAFSLYPFLLLKAEAYLNLVHTFIPSAEYWGG